MWLYVFGSVIRGEIDPQSDVDVLAVVESKHARTELPKSFLVYSRAELEAAFTRGDLFSHHLTSESVLVYSRDGSDIIRELGPPAPYAFGIENLESFCEIAETAVVRIKGGSNCLVFDCGVLYMAIRDVAMILSYHEYGKPSFSKYAPYTVTPHLRVALGTYETLKRCRATSTRGAAPIDLNELSDSDLSTIEDWLISARRVLYERLQIENRLAEKSAGSG